MLKIFYILIILLTLTSGRGEGSSAWTGYTTSNSNLSHNNVNALAEDLDSRDIWAGTDNGINRLDIVSRDWHHYSHISTGVVYSVAVDTDNIKWFGLSGAVAGLYREFSVIYSTDDIKGYPVNSIVIDDLGLIYMGTGGQGVLSTDEKDNWDWWMGNDYLPSNIVNRAILDSNGDFWFGTNGGVAKATGPAASEWKSWTTENSGMPANHTNSLIEDSEGNIWFATVGGLAVAYGGDMENIGVYTVEDGLPENSIRALAEDKEGNIWAGTSLGAAEYDGSSWTIYHIRNSGLLSNNINDIFVDRYGGVWFATTGGVNRFLKQEVSAAPEKVRVQGGAHGYVNPSVGDTARIHFNGSGPGKVRVKIYNNLGMLVEELSRDTTGGEDYIIWDCSNLSGSTVSSGVYTVYIKGPGFETTARIPVVR